MIYLAIFKGIGWSGKLVYFTATFPFVLLIALFFISVTREGAGEGIKYYLTPSFKYLLKFNTWRAGNQSSSRSSGPSRGPLFSKFVARSSVRSRPRMQVPCRARRASGPGQRC